MASEQRQVDQLKAALTDTKVVHQVALDAADQTLNAVKAELANTKQKSVVLI